MIFLTKNDFFVEKNHFLMKKKLVFFCKAYFHLKFCKKYLPLQNITILLSYYYIFIRQG